MRCNCPPAVLQYAVALCVLYLLLRDIRPMRLWMQITGRNSVREHFMPKVSNKNLKGIVAVDENNNMVQLTKADFESVINNKFNEVRSTIESTRTALEAKISTAQTTANSGVSKADAAQRTANGKQNAGNYLVRGSHYKIRGYCDKGNCRNKWFYLSSSHGDADFGSQRDNAEWDKSHGVTIKIE